MLYFLKRVCVEKHHMIYKPAEKISAVLEKVFPELVSGSETHQDLLRAAWQRILIANQGTFTDILLTNLQCIQLCIVTKVNTNKSGFLDNGIEFSRA